MKSHETNGDQCDDVVYDRGKLNDHIRMIHETNGDQCNVVVYDRGKLKDHIRRIHEKGHCDVKQVRARGCERGRRIRDD